jgi:hypothetical protein
VLIGEGGKEGARRRNHSILSGIDKVFVSNISPTGKLWNKMLVLVVKKETKTGVLFKRGHKK